MMTAKELHNKPLIAITNGRRLGEIKDVYLDPEATRVMAVLLGTEGIINRRSLVIDRAFFQVYGIDAWLIGTEDAVVELSAVPTSENFLLMGELRGREMNTDGGTKIGTLADVVLDGEARVLGFTLGRVYVQGTLAEKKRIVREAVTNMGSKVLPMIVDLVKAESLSFPP